MDSFLRKLWFLLGRKWGHWAWKWFSKEPLSLVSCCCLLILPPALSLACDTVPSPLAMLDFTLLLLPGTPPFCACYLVPCTHLVSRLFTKAFSSLFERSGVREDVLVLSTLIDKPHFQVMLTLLISLLGDPTVFC